MATKFARIPAPTAARKGKTWPRGPVDQTIREPSDIVGEHSGKVYATLAENAPEALKIIPKPGVKHYARGGRVDVRRYAAGGVLSVDAAQQNDFSAKNSQLDTTQSAYNAELGNANAQLADEQKVAAQAKNTADLEGAARAQTTQNTEDQQYAALGVAKPVDVAVAPGGAAVSGAPGARTAIQSQEQVASDQAARDRATSYAQSRVNTTELGLAGVGTSRADLALAQSKYAASLQPPTQTPTSGTTNGTVTGSSGVAAASTGPQVAQPNEIIPNGVTKTMPLGYARNPDTGRVEPVAQVRQEAAAAGAVYDPANRSYTTEGDLKSRTDAFGNVSRADGTLVSPQGNELRTNPDTGQKQWTDPLTGNVLVDPKTWQDPKGNMFHITNDKTGTGYWESPGGFVLGADGIWENKATGEQIIDGVRYSPQQLTAYRATKTTRAASINIDAADAAAATDTAPQYDENGDPITP